MENNGFLKKFRSFLDFLSLTNLITSGKYSKAIIPAANVSSFLWKTFFSIENMISLNRSVGRRSPASRSAHTLIICKAADFSPSDVRKPAQLRRVPKEKKEYMQKMKRKSGQNLKGCISGFTECFHKEMDRVNKPARERIILKS
jgi:hypothetical protein